MNCAKKLFLLFQLVYRLARQHPTWNFSHLQYCASSLIEQALLHVVLNLLLQQLHLVWLAYGIKRRYSALVDGSHSGGQGHFLPTKYGGQSEGEAVTERMRTSITSSNTTKAVPFVFCSFPIRI